ncbi:MAG: hypothetical protein WDZ41_00115 [Candidatus Babeliales bacterium]
MHGQVIYNGIRECPKRYQALKQVLQTLPIGFKALDIGASQGYFSFRMAQDFKARCVMIEDGYTITNFVWETADYLKYLCELNSKLKSLTILKKRFFLEDFKLLSRFEKFDVVLAFSVIHHIRKSEDVPFDYFLDVIDEILGLAPVVLIENPINTGEHTFFIRNALLQKGGKVIYTSKRGTLIYEIYLFDRRKSLLSLSIPNITRQTYTIFNGVYTDVLFED